MMPRTMNSAQTNDAKITQMTYTKTDPQIDALVKTVQARDSAYVNFVKNNLGVRATNIRRSNDHVRRMLELIMQKSTGQSSLCFLNKIHTMLVSLKGYVDDFNDGAILRLEIEEALDAIETLKRVFTMFSRPGQNHFRGVMDVLEEPLFDLPEDIPEAPTPFSEEDERSDAWSDF